MSDSAASMDVTNGEKSILNHGQEKDFKFYSSWFCPYAQRVWISLEEKGVDYQYIEINPYEDNQSTDSPSSSSSSKTKIALSFTEKKLRHPLFMKVSPRGLIPAIAYKTNQKEDKIADSMVCLQYIDEVFSSSNNDNGKRMNNKDDINNNWNYDSFLLGDAAKRAHIRFWCIHVNERIIPHYYKILMCKDGEQESAKQNLLVGLKEFAQAMVATTTTVVQDAPTTTEFNASSAARSTLVQGKEGGGDEGGPFFMGNVFSIVDIALAPWFQRILSVLKAYRQFELPTGYITVTLPPTPLTSDSEDDSDSDSDEDRRKHQTGGAVAKRQKVSVNDNQQSQQRRLQEMKTTRIVTDPDFVRLHIWYDAISHRPSFQRTVVNEARLIENYSGYADATATSDVAQRMVISQQHHTHQQPQPQQGVYEYEHVYGQVYNSISNNNNDDNVDYTATDVYNGSYQDNSIGTGGTKGNLFNTAVSDATRMNGTRVAGSRSSRNIAAVSATLIPPKYEIPLPEHMIGNLISLPHFAHLRGTNLRARMNCRICNTKQSTFCVTCSTDPSTGDFYSDTQYLFPVCNLTSERPCFVNHLNY